MGNCSFTCKSKDQEPSKVRVISRSQFTNVDIIGKGGFGRVYLVSSNLGQLALKEMDKNRVISKNCVNSVLNELSLLKVLKHPFIVNIKLAFQDRKNLYMLMEPMTGGDMRYQIVKHHSFTEDQTRFYVACLISALEYVHFNGIIHGDVKPENLVLDSEGYLHLTDFGVARMSRRNNWNESSGTPSYMAPEILFRQDHTVVSDYYAMGVIIYEFMLGRRPYIGGSRDEMIQSIPWPLDLSTRILPSGWSPLVLSFLKGLLQKNPEDRLGASGTDQIKSHPWLADFKWNDLFERKIKAPLVPEPEKNYDIGYVRSGWNDNFKKTKSSSGLFAGYFYIAECV